MKLLLTDRKTWDYMWLKMMPQERIQSHGMPAFHIPSLDTVVAIDDLTDISTFRLDISEYPGWSSIKDAIHAHNKKEPGV